MKIYSELLNELNLNSMERRRDRYRIIYCWKVIEGTVPQTGLSIEYSNRRGRLLKQTRLTSIAKSFNKFVIKVWNELPKFIQNYSGKSVESFKITLDKYLKQIEDNPHSSNERPRRCSNNLIEMIKMKKEDNRRDLGALFPTMH